MAEQAKAYFDKFLKKIKGMKKLAGSEMPTDFLQRTFRQYTDGISGSLSNRLNQRVVISDSECASILNELSNDARTNHLNDFAQKVIREGYEDCIKQMQETASYGIDFAESILKSKIQDMQRVKASKQQKLEQITRELSSKALTGKKKEYAAKRQVLDTFLSGCGTLQSTNQQYNAGKTAEEGKLWHSKM
jgi:DNA-binding FrmR family transcriptional regulator